MTLGTSKQAYGEPSYWDNRYSHDLRPFDWYQKHAALAPLLGLYLPRHGRILIVGCGNSGLGEGMVNDGFKDVVNIDISSVVIDAMQKKYQDCPELKYIRMDVQDMNGFETGSFDAVIDKVEFNIGRGAVVFEKNDITLYWSVIYASEWCGHNAQQNAAKMLKEIGRVLKGGGFYMLITYGAPSFRLSLLREPRLWTIKLHVIEKLGSEGNSRPIWELTEPVPLNEDGSSGTADLGGNPDVHYIYVCSKDESLRLASNLKGEERG